MRCIPQCIYGSKPDHSAFNSAKLSTDKEIFTMAALTFDTLKFANKLKAAGVPPEQAEAEAAALSEVLEVNLKELATKEDLKDSLKDLELKLDTRFERLMGEMQLLKWMVGILIAGVLSLVLKAFF
jgi:hypothetical protein